jgi:nicotinamide mononucleotide adenylyltransferase
LSLAGVHPARLPRRTYADVYWTGEPGLWSSDDLDVILGAYGAFIIERSGTDIDEALASLRRYVGNIWIISQVIQNDISSTKVRLFLKKDLSVR